MPTKTKKKLSKSKPDPVLACLIAARKRITPKGAWCQGAAAKDADGCSVYSPDNPAAVSWCALGATGLGAASGEADAVLDRCVPGNLANWNDYPKRTQKEVLALFDKAIALRRKDVTRG